MNFLNFFVSASFTAGILLLAGCGHDRVMLTQFKESKWYKSEAAWANKTNEKKIKLNSAYILVGQIREIRYNYRQKQIVDVTLSPAYWLAAPSLWARWFGDDPIQLDADNDKFSKEHFPEPKEYWAFGVIKNFKGRYGIKSAVKLIYNDNTESLKIIIPPKN